jgi:thioredoxin-like negative regulator of GroEL
MLLSRGCVEDDINSCLELATFQAAKGERDAALRELNRWMEKSAGPHVGKLRKRIGEGFQPKRLGDIFQIPIDGSSYFLDKAP